MVLVDFRLENDKHLNEIEHHNPVRAADLVDKDL